MKLLVLSDATTLVRIFFFLFRRSVRVGRREEGKKRNQKVPVIFERRVARE